MSRTTTHAPIVRGAENPCLKVQIITSHVTFVAHAILDKKTWRLIFWCKCVKFYLGN